MMKTTITAKNNEPIRRGIESLKLQNKIYQNGRLIIVELEYYTRIKIGDGETCFNDLPYIDNYTDRRINSMDSLYFKLFLANLFISVFLYFIFIYK